MSLALAEFAEKLVSISDFSQGKAGKIFADVAENNKEYIVLKNNQPTAVLVSVKEYREIQEKVAMFDKLMQRLEDVRKHKTAENTVDNTGEAFEDLVAKNRLTEEELEALAQCMGELEE